ncbi:MAG: ring-cleaving dioxygenase [Chloroflexi bacterium]|nr:ring-cleaving dioxygenase [Chloroflexota bacterium]
MQLTGLHHVTAITAHAVRNVEFYTQVLGLRLVKKTVNQDDVSAYHLFYGDKQGSPGTEVTFFDWPNVVQNQNGSGSIAQISLRVPGRKALDWWAARLSKSGVDHTGVIEVNGRARIQFADPEGLLLELADDQQAPGGTPWERSPVPVEMGIRGLNAVTLMVQMLDPLAAVLTEILGFQKVGEYLAEGSGRPVTVFATGSGGPGTEVHVEAGSLLMPGRLGRGGVHHVAFRVPDNEAHRAWRQRISDAGLNVTPVIDRFYFKSIYFRVPGGILFEIATDGPGFAADEDIEHLGEKLSLPPFLEPRREYIESQLRPLEINVK